MTNEEFWKLKREKEAVMKEKYFFLKSIWGLECGIGWLDLLNNLCSDILKLNPSSDFKVLQIKEKFAQLRFYTTIPFKDESYAEISKLISKAESESGKICEECGKPGKVNNETGWWFTACDEHTKLRVEKYRLEREEYLQREKEMDKSLK